MENKKYTYKEWWDGEVYLETCPVYYTPGEDIRIRTKWSDFNDDDIAEIKNKQKELFEEQCKKHIAIFKNVFTNQFQESEEKQFYLKGEINDLNKIIIQVPKQSVSFTNRDFTIDYDAISHMQRYIKEQIIRGKKNYDFIHSPNYKFQKDSIPDEVYARVCYDYNKWLLDFANSQKKKTDELENILKISSVKTIAEKERLGVPVIALIHFYNNILITRDNCKEIAAQHEYINKTSGEGLFQDYIKYSKKNYRISLNDQSLKANMTKLSFIEKARIHLKGESKKQAEADFKILEALIKKAK